jgi:hypothetical protein
MLRHKITALTPLLLAGCATSGSSASGASQASAPAANAVIPGYTLVATLNPMNASGNRVSGTVRLSPTDRAGELRAEIDIRGGGYQSQFPWVVRKGQCGERGEDLGTPVNYRLIETKADGMGRLNAVVRLTIPEGQTHHVAVLASPTQRGLVISCGVLSIAT